MTNPATLVSGALNVYTAPANTTLAASTPYWLVTSSSATNFGTGFEVATTATANVDSGTAAGWTVAIGNGLFKTDVRLAPWTDSSNRVRFQIRGTAQTPPANAAPTFADTTLTRSIAENTAADANVGAVIPVATDTDSGDTLTYTMEGTDAAEFNFNATTRQITTKAGVTYDFEAKSSYSVTIKVTDETDTDTVDVTITLTDVNEPPSAPGAPTVAATSGSTTSLDVSWTAPANSGKPAIASYDLQYRAGTSGSFTDGPQNVTGTSTAIASLNSGTSYQVQVRATNDEGDSGWSGSGNGSTSTPTNNPPVLANVIPDQTATAGTAFSYQVPANTFNDTDTGDTLSYTAMKADDTTLPTWLTFTAATRTFTGTPAAGNLGTVSVKVIATDTSSATVSDEFDIMVIPAAPAGLRAETGDGRVRLSWTEPTPQVDHAYRYAAGASVPPATAWTAVGNIEKATALISGLTNGTAHAFEVRVVGSGGVGPGAAATISATPSVAACSAPSLGGRRSVWSATLTVGRTDFGISYSAGYNHRQGSTLYGSLSPSVDFSIGGTSYTINVLDTFIRSGDRRIMSLGLADARTFPDAVRTALRLHWCSDSSGFIFTNPLYTVVDDNDADWSIHTTREVALSLPANNAATGAPTVTGTAQAGETLTAGMGNIADADGLPATFPGDYEFQWVRVDADGTSNASDITNATANAYTLTADDVGKRVRVRVSFFDVLGGDEAILGAPSVVVVSAVPGAPTGLTATASGTDTISLSWTAPADNGGSAITGYKIEVSTDNETTWSDLVADTTSTATTYEHTGLAASTTRHYRVSAINSIGTGTASDVVNTTTDAATATAPGAPTGLTATASGSSTINLSWTAPTSTGGSAITGYKIEVSTDSETTWTDLVANTASTATSYEHAGLAGGTTRHYRVSAINGIGTSATASNVANATTGPTDDCAGDTTTTCSVSPAATPGGSVTGNIEVAGDYDWFRFSVTSGVEYQIDVEGAATSKGTVVDPFVELRDSTTLIIASNDDGGTGLNARLVWTADRTGIVYAEIGRTVGSGSTYTLTVTVRTTFQALVSNIGQTAVDRSSNLDRAQRFTTGSNAAGYTLASIDIISADDQSTEAAVAVWTVGSNGFPDTLHAMLTAPTSFAAGTLAFTAPPNTTLDATTTYAVVVQSPSGNLLILGKTSSDNEDPGAAAGWSIHNAYDNKNTMGDWGTTSTSLSLRLAVNGSPRLTTVAATAPGAPTSLSATASGSSTINLSWTAPSSTGGSAITGYKIEVSSDGGSSWNDLVADTGNANRTYAHRGLADGATRHYRVSAINSTGTGTHSNVANATAGRTTVTFNASSYTAEESGAPAAVKVQLSEVPSSAVTIPLVVTHLGGATTGDYEGLPSSVTFWTTGRSRTFRVTAIDDSDMDGGESVQIGFGTLPTGYVTGTHRTATVALVDDETELMVDFGTGAPSTPIYVRESDTDLHRITVTLRTSRYNAPDGNPRQPVTIPLVVTHLGGATPDDYEGLPSSVTFAVGESVTGFDMRARPDRRVEIGEGLRLDFGALPSGVRKGAWGPYETIEFLDEAASVPGAPTSLSATASGSTGIDLSWTAPAGNGGSAITGYKIEVSPNGTSSWTNLVANTGNANTTYAHRGLAGGTTRYYRVSAINANGASLPSNVDDATTGASVPGAPASLSATSSGSTGIDLSWSVPASNGGSAITGYKIEASSDGGSSWNDLVADTGNANTTYAHTGLAAVATRHYRVSAINANGTGAHSNVANATTGRTTVTFNASSYTAAESGATAAVTVELSAVPSSAVTIPLVVTHLGGATTGDYEGLPSSVTFWTTGRSRTFRVTAIDDSNMDGGKSVQIGFGTLPTGYAAGTHQTATVALVDDETERIVNFGTGAYATVKVREGPVPHRLTMVLDSEPQQPVTIPLVVTHRGGATPDDYEGLPSSVTFAAGAKVAGFDIRAIPDQAGEIGEGLRLDFGALPAGVRKGAWGPYETIAFVDAADAAPASVSVSGPLLTLSYPGALDAGSTPSGADFVVLAGPPGGEAVVPVTSVRVDGNAVLLALARPVAARDTVTLTYLMDAMHPIRGADGLLAAPLADEPARNETGIPPERAAVPDGARAGVRPERLDLSSRNLTDLSALTGLSGVRELDLRDNAITDLSPLSGLSGLRVLDLSGNRIEELWPLAGLPALQRLNLSGNRIADIGMLSGLGGLRVLDLSGNRIEELWPLAGLPALQRLNLSGNRIADIGMLSGLGGLRVLDLSGNRIEELWPLAGLPALQRLNLSGNRIADIGMLSGLGGLRVLLLDRNRVADAGALSPLTGLANLGLSENRIEDIGLLGSLGPLRRLDLSGNAVADVSALGDVSELFWLRLSGNPVSDVAPLERLEMLRWLWLDQGAATSMEALALPAAGRGAAALWIERVPAR